MCMTHDGMTDDGTHDVHVMYVYAMVASCKLQLATGYPRY